MVRHPPEGRKGFDRPECFKSTPIYVVIFLFFAYSSIIVSRYQEKVRCSLSASFFKALRSSGLILNDAVSFAM